MAASYALSWCRSEWAAEKLRKPVGRAVSAYRSSNYKSVKAVAEHINSLCAAMDCKVEIFR